MFEIPDTLLGMRVRVSPMLEPKQKLYLSDNIQVTDGFRERMNKWLADTFGYEADIVYFIGSDLYVSPRAHARLSLEVKSPFSMHDFIRRF